MLTKSDVDVVEVTVELPHGWDVARTEYEVVDDLEPIARTSVRLLKDLYGLRRLSKGWRKHVRRAKARMPDARTKYARLADGHRTPARVLECTREWHVTQAVTDTT
jgi:hypothetical protein